MKQRLLISGLIALAAALVMLTLNASIDHPNKYENGFKRRFFADESSLIYSMPAEPDITDISTIDAENIYFQTKSPYKIASADLCLKAYKTVQLNPQPIKNIAPLFFLTVIYPKVFVLAGNARVLLQGDINSKSVQVFQVPTYAFNKGLVYENGKYLVRALDTASLDLQFYSCNVLNSRIVKERGISPKLHDAGFTHDGMLRFDNETRNFVYVDYYSNHITCFDTALRLKFRSHTIDTICVSTARPARRGTSISNSKPPVVINQYCSISNGRIYIISNLKSDNQSEGDWRGGTTVDVYDDSAGQYIGSYYMKGLERKSIKDFKVNQDKVFLLTENAIKEYQLIATIPKNSI